MPRIALSRRGCWHCGRPGSRPGRVEAEAEMAMHAMNVSLLVGVCIFAAALVGMSLHRLLPDHHLSKETQDVVRLGTGMLSVLASLVLGLLIATAKTSYDTTDHEIR